MEGKPSPDWVRRIPVWACDHLWSMAESGGQKAREAIADAASTLATDLGDGVALCRDCESGRHATMTRRWVNTFWIDGDHRTLTDVGDDKDGTALLDFDER